MVHQYVQTDRGNNLGSSVVAIVLATAVLRAVATAHTNSDTKSSQLLPVSPAPRSRLVPRYRCRGMPCCVRHAVGGFAFGASSFNA